VLIASPPIVLVYMGSYYDGSMTHATYIGILMNTNMGAFFVSTGMALRREWVVLP
jgi:hypothetical protein